MSSPSQGAGATAHFVTTTLRVEGMTCGACTSAVESAFKDVEGVGSVSVSLVMERAVVQHDPSKISADTVKEEIEDRGFDAEILSSNAKESFAQDPALDLNSTSSPKTYTTTVAVGGMTCGACTSAVENAFKDVPGVVSFNISLLSERAVVEHDPSLLAAERIQEIIDDTGFDATVIETKTFAPAASLTSKAPERMSEKITTLAIGGMFCGSCTSAVESGFRGIHGVIQFNISLLAERAVIRHDPAELSADRVVEIIEEKGFDAHVVSSVDTDTSALPSKASIQLKIYGLPSEEAAANLESKLHSMAGVLGVYIDLKTSRASMTLDSNAAGIRAIVEAIEAEGYNALVADTDDNNAQLESLAKTKEIQEWRRAFHVSLSFAIPVFLTSMFLPAFIKPLDYGSIALPIPGLYLGDCVCLALTIPVQFGVGRRFYRTAFKSISHGSPTMDVLVVLGTSAAFFFSVAAMIVSVLTPPHNRPSTVFDTSTMLITFITLGRLLENGAKSQTSRALSRLMSLAPSMATIYVDPIAAQKIIEDRKEAQSAQTPVEKSSMKPESDSQSNLEAERMIPTELIQVADLVILRPGDKIPADGIVLRGHSYVDESMVTGEAMPILKKEGSTLIAGTVNGAARMDFRVTRAGRDTQLSQIVRLVQEAQTSRAPIQRVADIIAGYFVPTIIALGVFTFVLWMVLSHVMPNPPKIFLDYRSGGAIMVCVQLCISVIVFACPCALGLSTPTAVMVGTGVGAEQGILVKGGATLEKATKITHVVFDKTGTLTFGKMSVGKTSLKVPHNSDKKSWRHLFWTAVGLSEMGSEHPIGKAIISGAKERLHMGTDDSFDGSVENFAVEVGKGVSADVTVPVPGSGSQTHQVLIGNEGFLAERGVKIKVDSVRASAQPERSEQPPPSAQHLKATLNLSNNVSTESLASSIASSAGISESLVTGFTTIHVAINNTYAGNLQLSDSLKPSAAATIAALRRMKISSSLITGDAHATAAHIANLAGISPENTLASCTPSQKQAFIRGLQSQGHVVAMVGDGINDSPALATADVGISLASGTDVAMEAADIVLMHAGGNDLLDVAAGLDLARTIFRRIKLNLMWATCYNVVGLPFAMGMFLPWGLSLHPMAAGAAMACSSVSVVVSSLLLKFWKRPKWMSVAVLDNEIGISNTWRYETLTPRRSWFKRVSSVISRYAGKGGNKEPSYVPLQNVGDDVLDVEAEV